MAGISSRASGKLENRRKFNDGTELNNDFDISFYETDFRNYDPQIGRFLQIDELAESYLEWSPYVYALNNPILLNDPTGLKSDSTVVPVVEPPPPPKFQGKYIDHEIVINGKKKPTLFINFLTKDLGPSRTDAFDGFWGKVYYFLSGGNIDGNHYRYNGQLAGPAPIMGYPPLPAFGSGKLFIKGFGFVNKETFHRLAKENIKKAISKEIPNYNKIIGRNFDISVENGLIKLIGNGEFKGNVLSTSLKAVDFLIKLL